MPRTRPPTSGYARIAQDEEQNPRTYDDSEDDDLDRIPTTLSLPTTSRFAPIQPKAAPAMHSSLQPDQPRRHNQSKRRMRSNSSGVDMKAINARFEKWADEIASRFKKGRGRGRRDEQEPLEIIHSVFQTPPGVHPLTLEEFDSMAQQNSSGRFTRDDFEKIVESVKVAIEMGMHPTMISQGSSGSYFARDTEGNIVGVFKPKDEEPYASRNPKWTKWIHRNLFPCCFGRACLIPNLSYVSEAAAYTLDDRLQTKLVPYTDIVHLSSKSFFYDFWDRRKYYRGHKPFPQKVGSFQVFLKGFKDANIFLRDHPWPDQQRSALQDGKKTSKKRSRWNDNCRPGGTQSDDEEPEEDTEISAGENDQRKFFWTEALQQSFREELEKLVILDYIMRNTDRGLDNWMIKIDWQHQKVSIVAEPPRTSIENLEPEDPPARPVELDANDNVAEPQALHPYRVQQQMDATSRSSTPLSGVKSAAVSLGAIDNSLSWPWKHPDAWRSFPFGWLFLPVSLIGRPFSQKTRDHFLPLLTSPQWWSATHQALRNIFSQDSDFKERMFARQMAVMKGQAWNVVETLKTADHGPLELTRRARVYVWDDLVDIPVAVPMRGPSVDMRRKTANLRASMEQEEEEMDISAANGTVSPLQHDLLGLNIASTELPNAGRFDLSRTASTSEMAGNLGTAGSGATPAGNELTSPQSPQSPASSPSAKRVAPRRVKTGTSLDEPLTSPRGSPLNFRRRFSISNRASVGGFLYGDGELEGDLGYSAAEDMEKNQRKVIVERLELVKGRNPVFSWC
ncbi:MAG: phosphatidyl inositol kinase [Vezdaea aestivalis]|nr:MAG: phosphatidyl inositol kinase [Vezdaea aestivalis]